MHPYMKLYIRNWLSEFENKSKAEEGRYRRPMTQEEFETFFNDCMIVAQEIILPDKPVEPF